MPPLKIIFSILNLLVSISHIDASGYRVLEYNQTRLFAVTVEFFVAELIKEQVRSPAIQEATWTYAICDKQAADNEKDIECTVYYETHSMNGVTYREECQDILENMNAAYHEFIRIYRFGKGKSLLIWQNDDNTLHLDVIDFPECDVTRTHLTLSQKMNACVNGCVEIAVRNDDTYDVLFAMVKKEISTWYVTRYDAKGDRLKEPKEFLRTSSDEKSTTALMDKFSLIPMTPSSSIQSHLIVAFDYQMKAHALFLDKNGNLTKSSFDADIHIASTAHNLLGFCSIKNHILTCQQHDERGTKKLEKTIKLQHHGRQAPDYLNSFVFGTKIALIHNLPGGGFILVTEDCLNYEVCSRPADPHRLYMFKVGADGTRYRTVVVQNLSRERKSTYVAEPYGLLENEPNEYCLYKNYVVRDPLPKWFAQQEFTTQLVIECVSDELLSRVY